MKIVASDARGLSVQRKGRIAQLEMLGVAIPAVILALLLSAWSHFANERRSLAVALYLVFGLVAGLMIFLGLSTVLLADQIAEEINDDVLGARTGWFMALGGLALGIPLLPPVREILSRLIPIEPRSMSDMVGLSVMLGISVMMIWTIELTFEANGEEELGAATGIDLVLQAIMLVLIAFFAIGGAITRDLSSVRERLGLVMPTPRQVGISVLLIIPLFVVSALGGFLTEVFQPGFTDEIDEIMDQITGDLVSLEGALLIGITAGVGEEILFRGAMQPRYGLLFTSLIFTLIHVQYGFSFVLVGVFFTAIILGIQRNRMNTTCCIITHAVYNFSVVMLGTLA